MKNELLISTLCPNCNEYPLIYLNSNYLNTVFIKCEHCQYQQNFEVLKYLYQMKLATQIDINNYCQTHNRLPINYCVECKTYVCDQCEMHLSHQLSSLSIISTIFLTNQIKKAYEHINHYCSNLKKNQINIYIEKINKIEYAFHSFKSTNTNLLKLVEIMINNYNSNKYNWYLRSNIRTINEICINQCPNPNNYEDIITYYSKYNFIKNTEIIEGIHIQKVLTNHTAAVNSILLLMDGRLASCSTDLTIKILNLQNYNCDINIQDNKSIVTYINQLENGKLISSFVDSSIKIWTIYEFSYKCEHTIEQAHTNIIYKVIPLINNRIASCSEDLTIKIWNSNFPYNHIWTIQGHKSIITSMIQSKKHKLLLSGSFDETIRKWDLSSYQCIDIILDVDCSYRNGLLEFDDKRVIVGGRNMTSIVNIMNNTIEHIIFSDEFDYVSCFTKLKDGQILFGCNNGTLATYDISKDKVILLRKERHKNTVSGLLTINEHIIISSSFDKTIIVWNY